MVHKTNVLNKFIKPLLTPFTRDKWQSRNPDVRKKAVQELPVSDQQTLNSIAMNDPDEAIRAIAANKLSDLDLLQTIIMKGTNGTVKEAAQNRLFQLICGLKHPIPEFDVREKIIRGSRNSALLEFVAANAHESSLREITIKKISRDPLLGTIALSDNSPHIRQLAARQIAKRSTLERVTKNSRRKDKRVYKIVRNKLDLIIEDEQRPARLAKEVLVICDKLENLHKRNRLLQEKTTFDNYVSRWNDIQNFANAETTKRFQTICSSIVTSIDEIETDLKKEHDTVQQLDTVLERLTAAINELLNAKESSLSDAVNSAEKTIISLEHEWNNTIKALIQDELISTYQSKFQTILDLAETTTASDLASKKESAHIDSHKVIQSLTAQAKNMLDNPGFIPEKTISVLQNKFQQQLSTSTQQTGIQTDEIKLYQQNFESAIDTLRERLAIQQKNAKNFKQQILAQSENIKSLINNGQVSKAEKSLREEIKKIEQSRLLSSIEKQHYQNELQKIHFQLNDLSSWRNWAHDHERENLALKAEQLAQQISNSKQLEKEYTDITAQIKEFRKQWKSMRSHTQEDLWQRFNNACNLAYEHCQPFIDKQNKIRQDNLIAKQNICEQLEIYLKSMNWPPANNDQIDHSIDWIQVDKIIRQARKEWGATGFVERKHHKSINLRFDRAIEIIHIELKKIWHINQEKFSALTERVEALHDSLDDDLPDAINKAKGYQKQWKQIGPVSAHQRNKLWKRFRKGCDVIFNKRQENIEQKNNLNTERLREKEAICENLEALNKQPLGIKDLQNAFSDIEQLWLELKPQAKSLSKAINQRYTLAVDLYQQKINDLIVEQQNKTLEQIIKQADLCTVIESSSDSSEAIISQFNDQWQSLDTNGSNDSQLNARYKNALESIAEDKALLIQTELDNKQQFCLKHEILLGKETPEEVQQSRMKMQVELLNSNLGTSSGASHETNLTEEQINDPRSTFELQIGWYKISNYSQDKQLEQRFLNLICD